MVIGTLSKAFVSCGGFIAAEARVLEWLHFTLRGAPCDQSRLRFLSVQSIARRTSRRR